MFIMLSIQSLLGFYT